MIENPLIVTTPRTGSTIICHLLGEIAQHKWEYKSTLYEYLNVSVANKDWVYDTVDGIVTWRPRREDDPPSWTNQTTRSQLVLNRLKAIMGPDRYMIKVFPDHITKNCVVFEELQKQYQFIFLERRDKVAQFLSGCAKRASGKSHYAIGDDDVADQLVFDLSAFESFVRQLQEYKVMKAMFPESPVLVYEDFMTAGGDRQALINLLGLQDCDTIPVYPTITKTTPYIVEDIEQLFVNQQEWNQHETRVKEILHKM